MLTYHSHLTPCDIFKVNKLRNEFVLIFVLPFVTLHLILSLYFYILESSKCRILELGQILISRVNFLENKIFLLNFISR